MLSREGAEVDAKGEVAAGGLAGNVVGWSSVALLVGVAMNFAAEILFVDVIDSMIDGVVPSSVEAIGTSLLVGGAMGAVIGSRIYRWPVITVLVVMVVYLALWPFALLTTLVIEYPAAGMAGSVLLHVASALASALYLYKKRRTEYELLR